MRIDFVFDSVCPWCYIGKRRLERALALRPDVVAEIRWRPFLLNPELPASGVERQTYLERKFGGNFRIQRIHGAATTAGLAENIAFNFEAIARTPSSINSHRLIQYVAPSGRQTEMVEAIFAAFFVYGRDIGDIGVLSDICDSVGIARRPVENYLWSGNGIAAIESDNARMHRLGVSGVPCYIFTERYAVAGAQEPDMLARFLDIAHEAELEATMA